METFDPFPLETPGDCVREARPFLKWAGGKQRLLSQYETYFPSNFGRYIEPFVGGGAVFFYLWNTNRLPGQAFLFDNNEELINTYQIVKNKVGELIEILGRYARSHSDEFYYQVRNQDRNGTGLTDVERAARTLYLNKTCYNGLYRVNSRGQFNVPMGSYKNPKILYEDILKTATLALQGATLDIRNYQTLVDFAQAEDFIYFDPPYDPVSKTASFTSYTARSFRDDDQCKLAEVFAGLHRKGCCCMLSNSDTPFILDLYRDFRIEFVQAKRAINSDANGRGSIKEVLVLNY